MEEKHLLRMKLTLLLITVAVVLACEETKEDVKCEESKKEPICTLEISADRLIPKKFPNKYSVTIFNCQRESQFKVIYKGEGDGNETESEK